MGEAFLFSYSQKPDSPHKKNTNAHIKPKKIFKNKLVKSMAQPLLTR